MVSVTRSQATALVRLDGLVLAATSLFVTMPTLVVTTEPVLGRTLASVSALTILLTVPRPAKYTGAGTATIARRHRSVSISAADMVTVMLESASATLVGQLEIVRSLTALPDVSMVVANALPTSAFVSVMKAGLVKPVHSSRVRRIVLATENAPTESAFALPVTLVKIAFLPGARRTAPTMECVSTTPVSAIRITLDSTAH